jgi:hypothetical protein
MLKIIRAKETSQIAVVAGSKRNKWEKSEQHNTWNQQAFRKKKKKTREYLKDKIDQLDMNSKKKNSRDL